MANIKKPTEDQEILTFRGDTKIIKYSFVDLNGTPINLSGFNLRFTVRDEFLNSDTVIQKTRIGGTPAGIYIHTDNEALNYNLTLPNEMVIVIDSADTKNMRPDIYPWDIEFSTVTDVYTALDGNLILQKDMTRNV